jgi:hypothetical protein
VNPFLTVIAGAELSYQTTSIETGMAFAKRLAEERRS